jgi:hypothetical protein
MQKVLLAVALGLGGLVAYVDSRPHWDDTGVTAAVLILISGVLGFLGPNRPWLWALSLGVWIPLLGIVRAQNYSSMLALVVVFAGAYGGRAIRGWLPPTRG